MKINPTPPPNSIKTRFAAKFVEAMKRINNRTPPSSSMADKYRRYRAVRAAALASMASAAGPKRAWSRAVLNGRRQSLVRRRRNPRENLGERQEEDLRRLVPGGERLEFCSLLSETADYIRCLEAQVQVMKNILHHSST